MRKLILLGLIVAVLALWWLVAPKTHAQDALTCLRMKSDGTIYPIDASECQSKPVTVTGTVVPSGVLTFSLNPDPHIGPVTEYMTCRKVFHDALGNVIARRGCKACKVSGRQLKCRRLYPYRYSHPGKK